MHLKLNSLPMNPYQKLIQIVHGLNNRFPNGQNPFQIVSRLCEEAGELAKEVNHFEDTGVKIEKYGQPNPKKMAKEVQDVLRSALAVGIHYGIEKELLESIDKSWEKLKKSGFIK